MSDERLERLHLLIVMQVEDCKDDRDNGEVRKYWAAKRALAGKLGFPAPMLGNSHKHTKRSK